MSIVVKEHGKKLCERMQSLRSDTNLVDLDLVCEDLVLNVHKVVMAASSKFFKEHLCKASNLRAPVILKLEDFNLKLKREAVSFLVEFIYKGEVNIPCELLTPVCEAAHALGVQGLTEFLPAPAKPNMTPSALETSTQSEGGQCNSLPASVTTSSSSSSLQPTNSAIITQVAQVNQAVIPHQWADSSNQFPDFYHDSVQPSRSSHSASAVAELSNNFEGDMDSNSHDSQPKSRLRIINGSMTSENIHELKTQNHPPVQQQQPLDNNVFFNWIGGAPGFDQQCNNIIDLEPSGWYNNQYNYTEEGSSWTTPAATTSSWPSVPTSSVEATLNTTHSTASEVIGTALSSSSSSSSTSSSSSNPPPENTSTTISKKDEESKLRPPPPLLAKGGKRPELEVRKDLLPTAPATAPEEIANVFQAEEDKSSGSQYKCLDCSMVFSTDAQLRSHNRHAHSEDNTLLLCPICKTAVLQGLENLKVHLYKSHGIGEVFRCEDCNFESSIKTNYTKHLATHHSEAPKKMKLCTKCGKSFKSKCGLKLHQQTHVEEDLHRCSFCAFKTPQKANLIKHLAVKHKKGENGEEHKMNKACPICPFKCVADHILKAHMLRKHTSKDQMKFKCSQCDYATVEGAALKKHVRFRHTNERPYMCSICDFSTHTHSAMARHKRGHEQTKPYVCDTCGQAYADRKRLRDHQVVHQTGNFPLPFDCDFCGYSTRRKDNLQAHIKRLHPEHDSKNHLFINEDGSVRILETQREEINIQEKK